MDELIATRRLEHIVYAYTVFGDKQKAIELCVNRFDEDTKDAFLSLYSKVDPSNVEEETVEQAIEETF